jgi:predicted TIM-barrel fold metal-dependent hydrolase
MIEDVCDSHFHVFGAADRYPLVPTAGYQPPVLSIFDYQALFAPLGVRRMVLVQPSCYGSDNRCMLEALATLGARGRAVVAVAPDVSDAELRRMHDLGARGIRVNAVGGSTLSIAQLKSIAPRLRALGWHVQTFLPKGRLPELAGDLLATGLTVVLDHFGSPEPALGMEQPAMKALAKMLEGGRCWVKLSAPFRISGSGAPFADMVPYARALVKLRPDRLVWGSDWPYIHFIDKLPSDYNPLGYFTDALRDPAQLSALLSGNSRELYQFA